MDKEVLIANIVKYCARKNEMPTVACVNAGVGKDFVSDIKRGRTPNVAKVMALAAYLGCCTSELVGDMPDAEPPSPKLSRFASFVTTLETLPPDAQENLVNLLRSMAAMSGNPGDGKGDPPPDR